MANELLHEARALTAALTQYQQALYDAMTQLADLRREISEFWERVADDRTLHDLADDAGVLLALFEHLDRVQSRRLTLECARL